MLIIPAIDLHEGKVVRLTQGAFDSETVYSASPPEVMQKWQREGAKLVHIVDLDGAREGKRRNLGSLKNILSVAKVPVQFGGGLRTFEAVAEVLNAGVWRAVVGTKALDPSFIRKLVRQFKERIAVGVDLREGVIQTQGWLSNERDLSPKDLCKQLERIGVETIIYTDVARDGTLTGPSIDFLKQMLALTKMNVIASGGISDASDLKQLAQIKSQNFVGVIIGKALYENRISLSSAVNQFENQAA